MSTSAASSRLHPGNYLLSMRRIFKVKGYTI